MGTAGRDTNLDQDESLIPQRQGNASRQRRKTRPHSQTDSGAVCPEPKRVGRRGGKGGSSLGGASQGCVTGSGEGGCFLVVAGISTPGAPALWATKALTCHRLARQ